MNDKLRCMPPPLSLLCAFANRYHRRRGIANTIAVTAHDKVLAAWCQAQWIVHRLKGEQR